MRTFAIQKISNKIHNRRTQVESIKRQCTNMKQNEGYKIGDYLYSSWGYEQTNVNFYKVVGVTAKSVKLVSVGTKMVKQDSPMSGFVVPVDNSTDSKVLLRRVSKSGSVKIDSFTRAFAWGGMPVPVSSWY